MRGCKSMCVCERSVAMHFPGLMIITQSSAYCLISGQHSRLSLTYSENAALATYKRHKIHICCARTHAHNAICDCVCVYFYVFVYVCVSACIFYLAYWMATPRGRGRLVDAPNFMLVLLSVRGELPARARICICVCVCGCLSACGWLTSSIC